MLSVELQHRSPVALPGASTLQQLLVHERRGELMYDVSPHFLNQLATDRRQSLQRTAAASSSRAPLRRRIAASVAQLRQAPGEDAAASIATHHPLTPLEPEVVMLVAEGLTNAQIAERLWISPGALRRHLQNAFGDGTELL